MAKHNLLIKYDELRTCAQSKYFSVQVTDLLSAIYRESLELLGSVKMINLKSHVENKQYFAFGSDKKYSRAINSGLYEPDINKWLDFTKALRKNNLNSYNVDSLQKILYSLAISFCACIDLIKNGDQKTPGTFFEYFVAYLYCWRTGVQPQNSIQILNIDKENAWLPTDLIFNLGTKQRKFHVPVKTSTRERSIMLWAHQKLLDGVYGTGHFLGTPVILAETKTDKSKKEVVEICVPDQWRLYQMYIAKLNRIYYFDMPSTYEKLNWENPALFVKPFSEFFFEWSTLAPF